MIRRGGMARLSAVALSVGLATAALFRPAAAPSFWAAGLLAVTVTIAWAARWRGNFVPALFVALFLCLGTAWGSVRVSAVATSALAGHEGRRMQFEVEVTSLPRRAGDAQRIPARIRGPSGPAVGERIMLEVARGRLDVDEGRVLRVAGRVRVPRGAQPSGFDEAAYLERMGIHRILQATVSEVIPDGRRGGAAGALDALRRQARIHLSIGLEPTYAALLTGVVLGDTTDIPAADLDAFRRSGTSHILSVSGLHVAGLAALVLALCGVARMPRSLALAVTLGVVVVFTGLAGAGAAVVRSTVMLALVLFARASGRRTDPIQVLAVAAAVVLAPNPLVLMSPGFQLSFAAVAGLLFLSSRIEAPLRAVLPASVASGVAVSLAATAATAPVSLLTFGQISVVGVVANLVIVPVITPVMGLGLAGIALGFASHTVAGLLDRLAGVLLAYTVTAAHFFARAPVVSRENLGLVAAALLGAIGVLRASSRLTESAVSRRTVRSGGKGFDLQQPPRAVSRRRVRRRPSLGRRFVLVALVVGAALGVGAYAGLSNARDAAVAWAGDARWPQQTEVRMLDVGEGSATLVRDPDRHAILIDAGPESGDLAKHLRSLGVRRLDLVLVSHPHADHFGGLSEIVGAVEVGTLLDDVVAEGTATGARSKDVPAEARDYLTLRRALIEDGAAYALVSKPATVTLGEVCLRLYPPRQPFYPVTTPWEGERLNAASVVAVVSVQGIAILIPGDAEAATLARYDLPPVDALFVPHHGSAEAVSPTLLRRLQPEVACISVGRGNSFGHPDPDTITVIKEAAIPVIRTDISGSVAITPADQPGSVKVVVEKR